MPPVLDGRIPGNTVPLCTHCLAELTSLRLPQDNRCRICGVPLISEHDVCMRCREREYAFDSHAAVFMYRGIVRKLLGLYKFRSVKSLGCIFAAYLAEHIRENGYSKIPIVPAPPRARKLRTNGWEHVQVIVHLLEHRCGCRVIRPLGRRGGSEQKRLDFERRHENVRGRIRICRTHERKQPPETVVLLDDVFTTGATSHESAWVLKKWGTEKVHVLTIAMD
mgnify:CR=1 FL=1